MQPSTKTTLKKIAKWGALSTLVLIALGFCMVAFIFWWYGRSGLPSIDKLSDYRPKQVSVIVDKDRHRIGEIYEDDGRRTFVPYNGIPTIVVDAFVAAEDQKFWTHGGIDYLGMVRALISNIRSGHKQGASTITQQVVKTFLLTPERTFKRKVQEIILARRLERQLTKEEIMTLYLNQINLGHGRYGVQEAARFYFGKDISNVSVGEAAVLAALPKSPTNISPRNHPERAKERQIYVLNNLVGMGKISADEAQKWKDAPIQLVKTPHPGIGSAPEFIDLAKKQLVADKGEAAIATLGATIVTTVDPALQQAARAALQKALRGVDKRLKIATKLRHIDEAKIASELAKLEKDRRGAAPKQGETYRAIVTGVSDSPAGLEVDLGSWKAKLDLASKDIDRFAVPRDDGSLPLPSERFARGDELKVVVVSTRDSDDDAGDGESEGETKPKPSKNNQVAFASGAQGAVVVMEIATRKVRAMVGGYSMAAGGFNRATMAKRQPGSSFKPVVYAAAVAAGLATPARIVNDAPEVYDLWKPQNYNKGSFEGPVRLRYALAKSINTVAIRVCHEVGPNKVRELASKLGIASELPSEMSIALGSGEVTPLEMASAFGTIAGGGKYIPPQFVESIDGKPLALPAPVVALSPQVAYVTAEMMRSVVEEGTGHAAKSLGITIAGKTGTSNDARDVWFVGATPDYVIAVWIGRDDNEPMGGETGGTTAVPVFVEVAKFLKLTPKAFPRPANIVEAKIDKVTGLLAAAGAPAKTIYSEVFVEGTAPTEIAPLPGEVTGTTLVTTEYDE